MIKTQLKQSKSNLSRFLKKFMIVGYRSEAATKAKLDKVAEIKRINAQIMAIKRLVMLNCCFMF